MGKKIFLVIFCFLIFLPSILSLLEGFRKSPFFDEEFAEKLPDFKFYNFQQASSKIEKFKGLNQDFKDFKSTLDSYLERDFILKPFLLPTYIYLKYHIFKTNPLPGKLVNGLDGWIFLGNSYSDAILESKGIRNFSSEKLESIYDHQIAHKKWLDSLGIKFYISVAANKETVYGNYLPIEKSKKPTMFEQLKSRFSGSEINFLDLSEGFKELKYKNKLYYKTDTHWNDFGAYLGYQNLINPIRKDFSIIRPITISEISKSYTLSNQKDLTGMLRIFIEEDDTTFVLKKNMAVELRRQVLVPKNFPSNPELYEKRYKCPGNNLKILVLRDSFFSGMEQYVMMNFGLSVFIWNNTFDKSLILKERPDIIVCELIERHLDILDSN